MTTNQTTAARLFVAYDDTAVYYVAATPEQAIERSRTETREPNAHFDTARITGHMAQRLETGNGITTWEIVDGWLVDTTDLDDAIDQLRGEAGEAGDAQQVALCSRALDGDSRALLECVWVLDAAWAARADA